MTEKRAKQLAISVKNKLFKNLYENDYNEIFVNLGKIYMPAIVECGFVFKFKILML